MILDTVVVQQDVNECHSTRLDALLMAQLFEDPPSTNPDMKSSLPHQRHTDDGLFCQRNYISMTAAGVFVG